MELISFWAIRRRAHMFQISKLNVSNVSKKMFIRQFKFQDKTQSCSGDLETTRSEGHYYLHTAQKIKFFIKGFRFLHYLYYLIFIIFVMATLAFNELKQRGTTELTEIRLI